MTNGIDHNGGKAGKSEKPSTPAKPETPVKPQPTHGGEKKAK